MRIGRRSIDFLFNHFHYINTSAAKIGRVSADSCSQRQKEFMRRVILLQNLRIFKAEWRDPDESSQDSEDGLAILRVKWNLF
jgi:hypothetical protein